MTKEENELYKDRAQSILLTTTPNIEGNRIVKYIDIISEEIQFSPNLGKQVGHVIKDSISYLSSIFVDTEQKGTTEAVSQAKDYIKEKLKIKAASLGANAVVGVDMETSFGNTLTWIRVSINGTAVIYESEEQFQKEQEARLLNEQLEQKKEEENRLLDERLEQERRAQIKAEAEENAKRIAKVKLEAAKNPGSFVYAVHEPIFSSFSSAKDLLNYLESLNIEDDYFKDEVLPRIRTIKATETFRLLKLSEAIAALKEMTA